jgi:N-acetylglutamate synthase-like GNAT family acetyltransferase
MIDQWIRPRRRPARLPLDDDDVRTGIPASDVRIRGAHRSDEPALRRLLDELSPHDRYLELFRAAVDRARTVPRAAAPRGGRRSLVAETADGRIVAHGMVEGIGSAEAELAVEVAADHRHGQLGGVLVERLAAVAWAHGTRRVIAHAFVENADLQVLLRRRFAMRREREGVVTQALLDVMRRPCP